MGRLTHLVFAQGERYPILLDPEGMPDFWVTLYVTNELRPSLKQTSIENSIRHIIHLKLWEQINGRDLILEFRQGRFLSEADLFSLRDHCLLSTRDLREWSQLKSKKNVVKLSASHPSNLRHMESVSKVHAANRIAVIAYFLHFTARALLRKRPNYTSLLSDIDRMKVSILAQQPIGLGNKGAGFDPDSKAPPPEVFEKFMGVIKVDSPDNPYKNPAIRMRNALMFEVLYETGIRSGELLALRIGDVDYNVGKISIVRRHDDPFDPRKRQPVAKTLERNVVISIDLARRLRTYVMDMRSKVINVKTPPFLFITHKQGQHQGQPISDTSFRNRILGPAISTNPELFEEITRHGFRHDHNNRISKSIDKNNMLAKVDPTVKHMNEKEEIQVRMDIYGWSSEQTAAIYNLRHTREQANALMRADMDELAKHLNKGNK